MLRLHCGLHYEVLGGFGKFYRVISAVRIIQCSFCLHSLVLAFFPCYRPFVHTISFSHAVPLDLKLLWVDVMEVVWVTILSKVANEDKNAKLKANPEITELPVVESHNVDPSLEIELTRTEELDESKVGNLSFELPKKALAACWPLIAMWPVLYAGYQVENALGLIHTAT